MKIPSVPGAVGGGAFHLYRQLCILASSCVFWHRVHADGEGETDAILLSMSDAPVVKALDLYREAS